MGFNVGDDVAFKNFPIAVDRQRAGRNHPAYSLNRNGTDCGSFLLRQQSRTVWQKINLDRFEVGEAIEVFAA